MTKLQRVRDLKARAERHAEHFRKAIAQRGQLAEAGLPLLTRQLHEHHLERLRDQRETALLESEMYGDLLRQYLALEQETI